MKKTFYNFLLLFPILFIVVMVLACATKSYINVNYHLPLSSYDLKGKKIFLEIKDMRSVKAIFSEKAKPKFKNFTGLFLFSLSYREKKDYVVGAFNLPSLFETAFSRRLENLGIKILTEPEKSEPVIEIDLKKFFLDLVDRKWVAQISYETRLIKDNKLLARETISSDAERYKLLSQGDVEKVLGKIFTSLVNKLDFYKLFQQAEL
ncbi:MAG: hypothetical protein DRH56_04170 [Deltaproteobacteria bacterium]|nr:MAG: hypothetical protein DRH56_04170 [Deltaproteobacteria bacterium]